MNTTFAEFEDSDKTFKVGDLVKIVRILVTGSREWTDRSLIRSVLLGYTYSLDPVLVHGGARGADTIAAQEFAELFGERGTVETHEADWDRYGPSAGPVRNAAMVALGADVCLAFPLGESRGTRGCMALAEKAGIPVLDYGREEYC